MVHLGISLVQYEARQRIQGRDPNSSASRFQSLDIWRGKVRLLIVPALRQ
jgi:hypothetical protein